MDVPGFLGCTRARVTAGAFLDAYAPERAPDLVRLLRSRDLPVLAFLAGDDPRRTTLLVPTTQSPGGSTLRIEMLSTDAATAGATGQPETVARIAAFIHRLPL